MATEGAPEVVDAAPRSVNLVAIVRRFCEVSTMSGSVRRVLLMVVAVAVAAVAVMGIGWASTITTPSSNPFAVPGDADGNPQSFSVVASPYAEGVSIVSVEQCDGVSPSTPGWSPITNCDSATAPAAVDVGANGVATFPANNPNFGFFPFKGASPQNLFNCLAPGDPSPNNGKPDFTNCQVARPSSLFSATGDQAFRTLTLPATVAPTTTTAAAATTTTAAPVTTTTAAPTTTTAAPGRPRRPAPVTTTTAAPTTTTTVAPTTTTTATRRRPRRRSAPTTTTTHATTTTTGGGSTTSTTIARGGVDLVDDRGPDGHDARLERHDARRRP